MDKALHKSRAALCNICLRMSWGASRGRKRTVAFVLDDEGLLCKCSRDICSKTLFQTGASLHRRMPSSSHLNKRVFRVRRSWRRLSIVDDPEVLHEKAPDRTCMKRENTDRVLDIMLSICLLAIFRALSSEVGYGHDYLTNGEAYYELNALKS